MVVWATYSVVAANVVVWLFITLFVSGDQAKLSLFLMSYGVSQASLKGVNPSMQKQFSDMSPREKVELGKGIIAVSELLGEIIQEGRWHSPANPLTQPPSSVV
jgi:hypothetical protein